MKNENRNALIYVGVFQKFFTFFLIFDRFIVESMIFRAKVPSTLYRRVFLFIFLFTMFRSGTAGALQEFEKSSNLAIPANRCSLLFLLRKNVDTI